VNKRQPPRQAGSHKRHHLKCLTLLPPQILDIQCHVTSLLLNRILTVSLQAFSLLTQYGGGQKHSRGVMVREVTSFCSFCNEFRFPFSCCKALECSLRRSLFIITHIKQQDRLSHRQTRRHLHLSTDQAIHHRQVIVPLRVVSNLRVLSNR